QLHTVAALLCAPSVTALGRMSSAQSYHPGANRMELLARLGSLVAPGKLVPPRRLEALIGQALQLQTLRCRFHNTVEAKMGLLRDHDCRRDSIPQV
ncbi:unnamed protein product, partial [Discosporangium mesarthrocarpum]